MPKKRGRALGSTEHVEAMRWLTSATDNFARIKSRGDHGRPCYIIGHYTDVVAEATAAGALAPQHSAIGTRSVRLAREASEAQRAAVELCRRSALNTAREHGLLGARRRR